MNYNELYRPKERVRSRRTAEEKRNMAKILIAGLVALIFGMCVAGAFILIYVSSSMP